MQNYHKKFTNIGNSFVSNAIFEYKTKEKQQNTVLFILLISLFGFLFIFYVTYILLNQDNGSLFSFDFIQYFESISKKKWGIYFIAALGGLFFFIFPLEVVYFRLLENFSNPWMVFFLYYSGILTAQVINYKIGSNASRLTKLMIPAKKFYRIKGLFNLWGVRLLIIMNILPLPSPILSAILGAFRYNFKRFFLFMSISSFILYLILFAIHEFSSFIYSRI